MNIKLLIFAIVSMTLALTFYTIGVWGERKSGTIKGHHVAFFGLGFIFDSTGTTLMRFLESTEISHFKAVLHISTGAIALLLMAIHFLWSLYVWKKGSEKAKSNFHKFSIVVWSFWLIPYIIGMILGMIN